MKLSAGNPALKVNKTTDLGTFAITLGDKAQQKKDRAPTVFVPSVRDPNAVRAPQMSIWERPKYVPENVQPMRRGADDHMKFKSKGYLT